MLLPLMAVESAVLLRVEVRWDVAKESASKTGYGVPIEALHIASNRAPASEAGEKGLQERRPRKVSQDVRKQKLSNGQVERSARLMNSG